MHTTGARDNVSIQSIARPVWWLGGTASALLALLALLSLCGCSSNSQHADGASPSESNIRVTEAPAPAPAPVVAQPEQPARIVHGPRPAEEINKLFEPAPPATFVVPTTAVAPSHSRIV